MPATSIAQPLAEFADDLDLDDPTADPAAGLVYLKALRQAATDQLAGGTDAPFTNTTVNGQTFTAMVEMSASEMFAQVSEALRIYRGTAVRFTPVQFSEFPL